jgi:hypothetical protein
MNVKSLFSLVIAFLAIGGLTGVAQTITGGANGTVADPSGAVIVGAQATATNAATNIATTTKTNKVGLYRSAAKFGPKLTVTRQTSSVSVNGALVPLLDTENGELETTLDAVAIESIPLQDRNFAELALFTPGAISTNPQSFTGANAIERIPSTARRDR